MKRLILLLYAFGQITLSMHAEFKEFKDDDGSKVQYSYINEDAGALKNTVTIAKVTKKTGDMYVLAITEPLGVISITDFLPCTITTEEGSLHKELWVYRDGSGVLVELGDDERESISNSKYIEVYFKDTIGVRYYYNIETKGLDFNKLVVGGKKWVLIWQEPYMY